MGTWWKMCRALTTYSNVQNYLQQPRKTSQNTICPTILMAHQDELRIHSGQEHQSPASYHVSCSFTNQGQATKTHHVSYRTFKSKKTAIWSSNTPSQNLCVCGAPICLQYKIEGKSRRLRCVQPFQASRKPCSKRAPKVPYALPVHTCSLTLDSEIRHPPPHAHAPHHPQPVIKEFSPGLRLVAAWRCLLLLQATPTMWYCKQTKNLAKDSTPE